MKQQVPNQLDPLLSLIQPWKGTQSHRPSGEQELSSRFIIGLDLSPRLLVGKVVQRGLHLTR